ncbi:KKCC1 [Dirofilaria immitis]|nr:KKCC1 [Dirofilaria immitis]
MHCSLRRKILKQNIDEKYKQLNQYRLIQEIGQGSYGIVKLAYNEKDKNLYVCLPPMRRISNRSSLRQDPMQAVQREIAILKKLNHPNIVLNDPNDKYFYMVFELLENGPVLEIPTESPLDERIAWTYFRDTVKGLEYLHYQKIVHRDIKPSNLLLSEMGHVKIADFGISYEFKGIDAFLSGTAGTPAFMAPEALTGLSIFGNVEFSNPFHQISDDSSCFYSGRAQDIWSLGITLYAFVYGTVPFWDSYVITLHKKIKNDAINFPEMPAQKDPGLRLTLIEIKDHEWITQNGCYPMPSEAENCELITVTNEEIQNCVRIIPHLDTLILVKFMVHRRRFGNPFKQDFKKNNINLRKTSSESDDSFSIEQYNERIINSDNSRSIDMLNMKTKNLLLDFEATNRNRRTDKTVNRNIDL